MGILNVTPDSFSDGGQHNEPQAALEHAEQMLSQGAAIIDVGGESARPGAVEVDAAEELRRTEPTLRLLREHLPDAVISIDTRHVEVARAALEIGADVVNDICGLGDPAMRELCARSGCGVVIMHMQGAPSTMQHNPSYSDVLTDVRNFLRRRVDLACDSGIEVNRICLDPGIGFGKSVEHNLQLIEGLEFVRYRNLPILMGLSRKGFLRAVLPDDSAATVTMSLRAAAHGAQIHRVHDVAPLHFALRSAYGDRI